MNKFFCYVFFKSSICPVYLLSSYCKWPLLLLIEHISQLTCIPFLPSPVRMIEGLYLFICPFLVTVHPAMVRSPWTYSRKHMGLRHGFPWLGGKFSVGPQLDDWDRMSLVCGRDRVSSLQQAQHLLPSFPSRYLALPKPAASASS